MRAKMLPATPLGHTAGMAGLLPDAYLLRMIFTTRSSQYAGAVAILALGALLLTPFLFHRYTERQRREITSSLDPAREAASDVRLALAREVAAIRGYLLTGQQPLLAEYMMARKTEE